MAALPALSKTYSTRRNIPFPAEATQSEIRRSQIWLLKANLMDQLATGTLGGTRNANSVWTMYYSCDSTTAGTAGDGVDRWTTYANVVQNVSGSAHSWAVLYNATSGIYAVIDAVNATNSLRVTFTKTAPSGGTTTVGPSTTNGWVAGTSSADNTNSAYLFIGDDTVFSTHYCHFTTSNDAQFFFLCSRSGLNVFSNYTSLVQSTGAHVSDTNNWFATMRAVTSLRGSPDLSGLTTAAGWGARAPNNSAPVSTGGAMVPSFAGSAWPGTYGVDSLTSNYPGFPVFLASLTPQVAWRGQIPDLYWCAAAPVGSSIPNAASQERVVAGELYVPFVGGAPIV